MSLLVALMRTLARAQNFPAQTTIANCFVVKNVVHTQRIVASRVFKTVHNRIAVFRAERGLSRRQLAEAVDVNPQTIGYLERGDYKPSLELALKVAGVFNVPVEMIFSLTPFEAIASSLRRIGVEQ